MKYYTAIIKPTFALLNLKERRNGFYIVGLMVINALLDFFSLASFLPIILSILNPKIIFTNTYANKLYTLFKFPSTTIFIIVFTGGVLLFVLVKNLISTWIVKRKASYAFNIGSDLASRALNHYMQVSFLDFVKTDYTHKLNTIINHPLTFAHNIILSITTIISETLVCVFILACMAFYDPKVFLLIFIIFLPSLVLFQLRRKNLKKINDELKNSFPLTLKYAHQVIEGFPEIKASQKESFFIHRFQKMTKSLAETFIKDQTLQAGTARLTEIIAACTICVLIIYAVSVHQHYQQTLVLLSIYAGASFRIIPSVNRILHAMQQIRTHEFIFEELKIPSDIMRNNESFVYALVLNKTVTLNNISYRYPNGPKSLYQVSITIHKGEKIAITGESGEGKTTFLLVLLGLLEKTEGELLVDGEPVQDKNAWRKIVGYVPQNPYILDGTVAENIAFGIPPENIDRTRVLQLINDLDLDSLLRHLENGIDTRIGERGAKLSGGQRQRLAIARVLYADVDILLLDEITNQLHGSMELEIMNLLNRLADKNKTIIMVTHKIAQANFFDAIFKLEKGRLFEIIPQE